MVRFSLPLALLAALHGRASAQEADLIVHHAKIVTVDGKFSLAQGLAVKDGRLLAVGTDAEALQHKGKKTRVIDAGGKMVLPGLYDSHTHPVGAASSEIGEKYPNLHSIAEVQAYVKKQASVLAPGKWIVLRYVFSTRLKEARFPTKAELDAAAPNHPVLYHSGPAGITNTMGLKVSGITKDTPNPKAGMVVKDPKTGEPTGMLRNALHLLKGVPGGGGAVSAEKRRESLKHLFHLYNARGLTSIADRNASRSSLDLYLGLHKANELTVRVNVARSFGSSGTRDDIARRFEALPGKDKRGGPTGAGDEWVRIGPIKLFLDGGMLSGSAYMREPWPKGETYAVTEDNYRGMLFIPPAQLKIIVEEAAKRKWQVTAHTAGEGGMDVLLDAYEFVNRITPIKEMRYCVTHANFASQNNLERCKKLGVCADIQPAWLWKDGNTLLKLLGPKRMRWFQCYKTWLDYTTIGGGSDHMLRYDSLDATNPWDPWLAIWVALTRKLERGGTLEPTEALTRKQALRLYTINNAYLHHEESEKGSLEKGKLADFIIIDRDYLKCPVDEVRTIQVLKTVLGGKIVYEKN